VKDEPPRPYPQFPKQQDDKARHVIVDWMNTRLPALWPKAKDGGNFAWDLLEAPAGTTGDKRLDSQYWRANVNPWDRYVLSAPHTLDCKLPPDESGVEKPLSGRRLGPLGTQCRLH
jgi:hypothetical protein